MKIIDNLSYAFSKDSKPVEYADPGEILMFRTVDSYANSLKTEKDIITEKFDYTKCNPAAGPVYINGAEPGDVLVVEILDIKVAEQGVTPTFPGCGPLWDDIENRTRILSVINDTVNFNGVSWNITPMIGVIGNAPNGEPVACGFPGQHGGNLDSKVIKKGARVYLPVFTPGALLQIGDVHATMGDCEMCGTALEINADVLVKTEIIKNLELNWPVSETDDKWYVHACDHDYPTALKKVTKEMQRLIMTAYGWDKTDTYLYMSLRADVEINQACKPCDVELVLRCGVPKVPTHKPLIER